MDETIRKMDLGGLLQREERREAVKKQEQQVNFDAAASVRRGLRSYLAEAYREIDIERIRRDPAYAFFKLANSHPFLT